MQQEHKLTLCRLHGDLVVDGYLCYRCQQMDSQTLAIALSLQELKEMCQRLEDRITRLEKPRFTWMEAQGALK